MISEIYYLLRLYKSVSLISSDLDQLIILPSLRIKVAIQTRIIEQAEKLVLTAVLLSHRP